MAYRAELQGHYFQVADFLDGVMVGQKTAARVGAAQFQVGVGQQFHGFLVIYVHGVPLSFDRVCTAYTIRYSPKYLAA